LPREERFLYQVGCAPLSLQIAVHFLVRNAEKVAAASFEQVSQGVPGALPRRREPAAEIFGNGIHANLSKRSNERDHRRRWCAGQCASTGRVPGGESERV